MGDELASLLAFVLKLLRDYGFEDFEAELATRPDKFVGDPADWDEAEELLRQAVEVSGIPYVVAEGEGAFYAPKIDVHVRDAIGRRWQLSTLQVDFQFAERFDLEYVGTDNQRHRPRIIHRALFGSFDRFFGVLLEHTAGALPPWLAPVQVQVLPVRSDHEEHAQGLVARLKAEGFRAEITDADEPLGARIRKATRVRTSWWRRDDWPTTRWATTPRRAGRAWRPGGDLRQRWRTPSHARVRTDDRGTPAGAARRSVTGMTQWAGGAHVLSAAATARCRGRVGLPAASRSGLSDAETHVVWRGDLVYRHPQRLPTRAHCWHALSRGGRARGPPRTRPSSCAHVRDRWGDQGGVHAQGVTRLNWRGRRRRHPLEPARARAAPVESGLQLMTSVAEARVLPETLDDSWAKVRAAWPAPDA